MHRREARITAALPRQAPVPQLLGSYDDGEWVALVLSDVAGRHPETPWRADQLRGVFDALDRLASTRVQLPELRPAAEVLGYDFGGWRRIADDPPARQHPWAARRIDQLCAAADRGLAALAGESLVHTDIRADNLLIGTDGTVTVVDWPHACRGAAWLDRLLLLVNVRLCGGRDTHRLLAELAATTGAAPATLHDALAGFAGFFIDGARRPEPPGLPTLRAFQQAQGDAVLDWLAELHATGHHDPGHHHPGHHHPGHHHPGHHDPGA